MFCPSRTALQILSMGTKQRLKAVQRSLSRCTGCSHTYSRHKTVLERNQTFKRFVTTFAIEEDIMRSFAKDLFVAKINMEWIFPFPTFDTSQELNEFNDSMKPLQNFLNENLINSARMDEDAEIHPDLIKELKKLRLFGMAIPENYDGLGLSNLKYTRYAEEIAATDMSVNMMLASHNLLAAQPILITGNKDQKKNYLPRMASGELIGAFCVNEVSCGSDITRMKTRATLSEDKTHWVLNGEKTSVNNGGIADVMIVFAKTEVTDVNDVKKDAITAFIVERSFGGIYNGPQEDKLGLRALNTCDVMFDGTVIPACNLLDEVGQGFRIASDTLDNARLGMVTGVIGQTRKLVNEATEYANIRKQFGKCLSEFELVREKIFRMSQRTYAMESVAYLTLGKMDQAIEEELVPDLSVDYAIAKIFCSEEAWNNANECINILGYRGCTKTFPYERILRDTKMFSIVEGSNDVLRLYIALSSLQQAETALTSRMRHLKLGTFRQKFTALSDWIRDEYGSESTHEGMLRKKIPSFGFTSTKQTKTWLDPYLEESGKLIEETVQTFYRRVYVLAQHFGSEINNQQLHLRRLADVAIGIYSMVAVLARCNKSLILGLRHREHERMLAVTYIWSTGRRCGHILEELHGKYTGDVDRETKRVGREMLEERRYTCSHPLELEHRYTEHPKYIEQLDKVRTLPEK